MTLPLRFAFERDFLSGSQSSSSTPHELVTECSCQPFRPQKRRWAAPSPQCQSTFGIFSGACSEKRRQVACRSLATPRDLIRVNEFGRRECVTRGTWVGRTGFLNRFRGYSWLGGTGGGVVFHQARNLTPASWFEKSRLHTSVGVPSRGAFNGVNSVTAIIHSRNGTRGAPATEFGC